MESSSLVSIIVPVYNVEAYLPACIDSLLAQTYKNIEILLVDDGSPDRCPAICDEYAASDLRVRVIHKENGGAASARNVGLEEAHGSYISFVDSDDWVAPQFIAYLLQLLKGTHADVSVCSFFNVFQGGKTKNPIDYPTAETLSQIEFLERFLVDWTSGMATNKLFRAVILNGVRYEEGHKIDDEFFTYRAIINCKKITIDSKPLYYYRMRRSSVMSLVSHYQERVLWDKVEYSERRYLDVSKKYPVLQPKFLADFANSLIRLSCLSLEYPDLQKYIKRKMRQYYFVVMTADISIPQKHSFLRHILPIKARHNSLTKDLPIRKNEMHYFD